MREIQKVKYGWIARTHTEKLNMTSKFELCGNWNSNYGLILTLNWNCFHWSSKRHGRMLDVIVQFLRGNFLLWMNQIDNGTLAVDFVALCLHAYVVGQSWPGYLVKCYLAYWYQETTHLRIYNLRACVCVLFFSPFGAWNRIGIHLPFDIPAITIESDIFFIVFVSSYRAWLFAFYAHGIAQRWHDWWIEIYSIRIKFGRISMNNGSGEPLYEREQHSKDIWP